MAAWIDAVVFAGVVLTVLATAEVLLRAKRGHAGLAWWVWAAVAPVVALALVFGARDEATAKANLRRMVSGMGPTYAHELEASSYLTLSLGTGGDDPAYVREIGRQKDWLALNPAVADIYTFVRDAEGRTRLLVDSETDYDGDGAYSGGREARTAIGELYDEDVPALETAFGGVPVFDDDPYTDRWGTWVSAMYPIFDASGRVHSVLGLDFPAEKWLAAAAEARRGTYAEASVLCVLIVGAGAVYRLLRRELDRKDVQGRLMARSEAAAQEASRAKSTFLANMSHELRTPMTAILGFADLLGAPALPDDERVAHARTIKRNGEQLMRLLNDLLDLSKIESGKFTVESIDCSPLEVLGDVASLLGSKAREKGLVFAVEHAWPLPAAIRSDPLRLRQILTNLIDNAIKFTPAGRSVAVRASMEGPSLRFDVADTGLGIAAHQMDRLFDAFEQVDASMARRFGGTGLGLPIARELARLLGGDVTVSSGGIGAGSTFTARVRAGDPAALTMLTAPPNGAGAPIAGAPAAALACRVLLAEDSPDSQRLLSFMLRRAGASVEVASDGHEAVRKAASAPAPFDVVLMDMHMPGLDGVDATRQLRALGVTTPIIALTANAMAEERRRTLDAGCDDFLTKPVEPRRLLACVARWAAMPARAAA